MRNLVKTAAAVAVAMAISTAANAVDSANSLDSLLSPETKVMRAKINENTADLTSKQAELERLTNEKKRVEDLLQDAKNSEIDNKAFITKNTNDYNQQYKQLEKTNNQKIIDENKLKEYPSETELSAQLEKATQVLNVHKNNYDLTKSEVERSKIDLKRYTEERENLRKKLDQVGKLPKEENDRLNELREEIKDNKNYIANYEPQLSHLKVELDKAEGKVKDLTLKKSERSLYKRKVDELTQKTDDISKKLQNLKNQGKNFQEKVNTAIKNQQDYEIKLKDIKPNLDNITKEVNALKESNDKLVKDATLVSHKELETRVAQAEGKAEEKIKNLNQEIDTNKKDVNEHLAKKADADKVKQDLAGKADKTTVEAVKKQLNEAKADKATVEAVKKQLNEAKADKATVEAVKTQLNEAKADKTNVKDNPQNGRKYLQTNQRTKD